ncbi:hypothetical protein [Streptomyces xanthophaeus]|uniref:hypothetical protein n=1 Tax=Streptomyces xanthophaeus TaxID=67385 RepID=UPI00364E9CF2
MRIRAVAVPLAAALLTLTACSSQPDEAGCKKAMSQQMKDATATGAKGSQPGACKGLDDATLQRLAGEVLAEQLSAVPTPTP